MKVFQVTQDDWVAADTLADAERHFEEATGLTIDEIREDGFRPYALLDAELDTMSMEIEEEDGKRTVTFREELNAAIAAGAGPVYICTKEG